MPTIEEAEADEVSFAVRVEGRKVTITLGLLGLAKPGMKEADAGRQFGVSLEGVANRDRLCHRILVADSQARALAEGHWEIAGRLSRRRAQRERVESAEEIPQWGAHARH